MSIVTVEQVSHSFGGRQILENASFRLLNGEHVGLIGANGEGKSTFLNILIGKMVPEKGKVSWCNRITIGYLDQFLVLEKGKTIREILQGAFQYLFDLEQEMLAIYERMGEADANELDKMMEDVGDIGTMLEANGFYHIDSKIEEIANGLGLGEIGLNRDVSELSGGQRAKVLLTKLLLQNPMILILDEPTNFLDDNHISWLKTYLNNYQNAFILVSHDIPFLNDVVNVIFHVENARLTRYSGDYEFFQKMYDLKKQQLESAYQKQQKEIDKLEDFIARNKARVATSNMAKGRQKKLDKMDIIELSREKPKPTFNFSEARTPGKILFKGEDLVIGYDEPLTRKVQFEFERGKKIAVKGVNGLGKTTLLRTILGEIPPLSGKIHRDSFLIPGYYAQEDSCNSRKTAMEEIWDNNPSMSNGEVRSALAKCGLTNQHITSQMQVLSGGECVKVRLCNLMLLQYNCLLLDEPTNHLDIDAKAELKRALQAFKGSIILVCHEPEFYLDWVDEIWDVQEWSARA